MDFLRKLLWPFSLLYGGVVAICNWMYDRGWLESKRYDIPIICVGNLSTGGTGKSPMTEYLVRLLLDKCKIAVLSRGYKRKSKGFREVQVQSSVAEVGDEPLQIKRKFPQITVAVAEVRQTGIEKLREKSSVILMDDAYQHRKVVASLYILLTSYDKLYVDDCLLPAGNLREPKAGAGRADIIVVTKCPPHIEEAAMRSIRERLHPKANQEIYFSKISYAAEIVHDAEKMPLSYLKNRRFLLVTGIANPRPLVAFLRSQNLTFDQRSFPDHHNFTASQIEELKTHPLILTTEKDYMRLGLLTGMTEIYYLPIQTEFVGNDERGFIKRVEKMLAEVQ